MTEKHEELKRVIVALQQWLAYTDAALKDPTQENVKAVQASGMNVGQTMGSVSPACRQVLAGILHDIHENVGEIPGEAFDAG